MSRHAWLAVTALAMAGCADPPSETATGPRLERSSPRAPDPARAPAPSARPAPPEGPDPCAVFTEAMLREAIALPEGAEVAQRRGEGPAHEVCTYSWRDPSFDEEAHRREMMQKMQEAARRGRLADGLVDLAAAARSGGEVSYTHARAFSDPETARRELEGAMGLLERGISHTSDRGRARGRTATLQAGTVEVAGVGDAAYWSERLQQLSVASGARVFHLAVKVEDEPAENLELAKRLAASLVD